MRYTAVITIECVLEVNGESFYDAKEKVNSYIENYDFGEMKNIDWKIDLIRNEHYEYARRL